MKKIIISLLAFLFSVAFLSGAEKDLIFTHLTVDDGLSQSTVRAIVQDNLGNIWIGTQSGLNRYDGYEFTKYLTNTADSTAIGDDSIYSLLLASDGRLWIGTGSLLSCYDFKERRFYNYTMRSDAKHHISHILEIPGGLLLSTDAGLLRFGFDDHAFTAYSPFSGMRIHQTFAMPERFLVATSKGLFSYNPQDPENAVLVEGFENYDISTIEPIGESGFWIGTFGGGIFRTDASLDILKHYTKDSGNNLPNDNIRVLRTDSYGHLWVGTYDGLAVYNELRGSFDTYVHTTSQSSLSHNSVWSIFMDNQKGVWIGTYFGGINYYNSHSSQFNLIACPQITSSGPVYGFVSCVAESASGRYLWIGTNDDGLFRYDKADGSFKLYSSSTLNAAGRMSDNIKCILDDGSGGIYFGVHLGGICHLSSSGELKTYSLNIKLPIDNGCYSLVDEGDGTLCVGTLAGLKSFDKKTGEVSPHPAVLQERRLSYLQIMALHKDSLGNIWIGTDAGLFLYSKKGNLVRSFENMSEDVKFEDVYVNCINSTADGKVWIGTNAGLFVYDPDSKSFTRYTMENGLGANQVYGILEDSLHQLWISTVNGLSCFDTVRGKFKNYLAYGRKGHNDFSPNAFYKGSDNYFYFGGHSGVTSFRPMDIAVNNYSPLPYVSDIMPFNGQQKPLGRFLLSRNDNGSLASARISAKNSVITIWFSVSNLTSNGDNIFSYCLEGFNKQWFETKDRSVTFSNLGPGKYTFYLKSANNDGKWCSKVIELPIRILPRWWQSIFAKVGLAIILILIAGLVIGSILNREKFKMQLDLERSEKEQIAEISKERVNFFINLSHELRTPLTLMLSPLKEIEDKGTDDQFVKSRLQYIRRSAMRLKHVVNQMLDYHRMELGITRIHVHPVDVDKVASECFSLFEEQALNKEMDYIYDDHLSKQVYPVDPDAFRIILMNLLSNAFKFTPKDGIVKLVLTDSADTLDIVVSDNGRGIPQERLEHIFDMFYQVDSEFNGYGVGLAIVKKLVTLHHGNVRIDSKEGEHTVVTVSLPKDISAYSEEEKVMTKESDEQESIASLKEEIPLYLSGSLDDQSDSEMPEEENDGKKASIIIVEPNSELRSYIASCFSKDFNVTTFQDGKEAADYIKRNEPDIVIAGKELRGVSGLRFCQNIKRNIQTCHIPVILLGNKDDMDEKRSNIEAGADSYIPQPFTADLIRAEVSNILKSRESIRRHYASNKEVDPAMLATNDGDTEFLQKALKVVEDNLDNDAFTSSDFADAMCMSRSNLYLKITSITGESATHFIRKIRFNKACELLLQRKYSVSEISAMVGFSSPSYFSSSFKKVMGCLPTEYGKKNNK